MSVCDWHAYLKNILIKTRARIENVSGIQTVQNPLNEINLLKAEYIFCCELTLTHDVT